MGKNNVTVAKDGNQYTITLQGDLGKQNVSQLVPDDSGLNRAGRSTSPPSRRGASSTSGTRRASAEVLSATHVNHVVNCGMFWWPRMACGLIADHVC